MTPVACSQCKTTRHIAPKTWDEKEWWFVCERCATRGPIRFSFAAAGNAWNEQEKGKK